MSANVPSFAFPAPVGGVPSPGDFPPSLFFEIAYILLIPLIAFRWSRKTSRTLVLIGVTATSVERIVNFGIRMSQANNPHLRTDKFMVNEVQSAYCATFLALANDCLHIARAYLVNSTRGTESDRAGHGDDGDEAMQDEPTVRYASGVAAIQMEEFGTVDGKMFAKQQATVSEVGVTRKHGMPDEPKKRRRLRIICIVLTGMFIVGAILGLVSGATYFDAITSPSKAKITQGARFVEAILGLVVLQSTNVLMLWALLTRPRRVTCKRALYLCLICCTLTIPPVYRLSVMSATTTSLSISVTVDPLNGHNAKALFYGLHLFPELIAAVLLLGINVRAVYSTGLSGDWGIRDRV